MKKIIAFFAAVCLIAVSGCGNNGNNQKQESTTAAATSKDENGKTSMVAYSSEEGDTTEQALAFLEEKVPLFKKYLDMRRTTPLTFETTITTAAGEYKTGLYIKDRNNIAECTTDPSGNTTTVLYIGTKGYQISSADKIIYEYNYTEQELEPVIQGMLMEKLSLSDVENSDYSFGSDMFEDKEYHRVTIATEDQPTNDLYFDIDTDLLAYMVSQGNVTRVDKIENAFSNDEIFNLPEGYQTKSFEELLAEYQAQMQAQQQQ